MDGGKGKNLWSRMIDKIKSMMKKMKKTTD